ncbi:hypothetical protein [Phaffia rhodozyma]|uniref:Wax synthase domain-containing protein n=1 Tax=Phaffia rhodozyma TaxID=264483 RepID=A0A0F7SQR1_PHARH|nr:hypothetical protein [Phaffia rhodozyma]
MHISIPLAEPLKISDLTYWKYFGTESVLLLSLAYLAQQKNTRPIRIGLAGLAYVVGWQLSGGFVFKDPAHGFCNYLVGLLGVYLFLLIPRLALLSEPYYHPTPCPPSTTIDLLINPPLTGWAPTPYFTPPRTGKKPFRSAAKHLVVSLRNASILVGICALAAPYPGFTQTEGFSLFGVMSGQKVIWLPGFIQPLDERFVALSITAFFGFCVYLFVEALYHQAASILISLGWPVSSFGEIFEKPWMASSVHEFWGKRWHPVFTPTFHFYSRLLPSSLKPVMIFLISGLIHDVGLLPLTKDTIYPSYITGFFVLQAVPLVSERLFGEMTGKRVGGWSGRIWVWTWMILSGCRLVEGWSKCGVSAKAVKTVLEFMGLLHVQPEGPP